jgi:F-type H+-transporting ATPase subunit delta
VLKMAELATIARPYADALFKAGVDPAQVSAVAAVAADPQVVALADNPKAGGTLVFNVIADVLARKGFQLSPGASNLLRTVIDNGRVAALPEIAAQLHALASERAGVFDATVYSAFPVGDAELAEVLPALEKRFGRKLRTRVVVDETLIGGVRVVVGDQVLDTSVKARLEQMKAALVA